MSVKNPRTVNNIDSKVMKARLQKMIDYRNDFMKYVADLHIKLQRGNDKTGEDCWTVSLIPVVDCPNCSECSKKCYDLRNDCWRPAVQRDRAKNSAIHKADPDRYWSEINQAVKDNNVTELRINVGGDLTYDDFVAVSSLGEDNPYTSMLFFTKDYKGINSYLDYHHFPSNVKPILSIWEGMEYENPHNLPCAHVLWKDGSTTAPSYGAYYCGGNCSECHINKEGCWTLKNGEHVIFNAH